VFVEQAAPKVGELLAEVQAGWPDAAGGFYSAAT
jgi:hypothetical protein